MKLSRYCAHCAALACVTSAGAVGLLGGGAMVLRGSAAVVLRRWPPPGAGVEEVASVGATLVLLVLVLVFVLCVVALVLVFVVRAEIRPCVCTQGNSVGVSSRRAGTTGLHIVRVAQHAPCFAHGQAGTVQATVVVGGAVAAVPARPLPG